MPTDYTSRLRKPLIGSTGHRFFTRSGSNVANGYKRVVIGARGPYVEFEPWNLVEGEFNEAKVEHYYYVELRTCVDNVKAYYQVRRVDYADYVPGLVYISPFDLYDEGSLALIEPLRAS